MVCAILGVPVVQRGYRNLDDRFLQFCLSNIQMHKEEKYVLLD